ncbi:MAG: type II toxin-antitoxin system RelB/DinJ family antitoxin [Bacilli bacterium]|nr:type II toxin-antitoxin system RelB/DinJ family antitoxin [Bacilli bacterium]
MAKVSTNISIDPTLKENSIALFSEFGLDLSTAISLFLQQSVREQRIPFEIRLDVPNEATKEALSEFEEMKKDKKKYKRNARFSDILGEL